MTTQKIMPPPVSQEIRDRYIGKVGQIELNGLIVNVHISDARYRYGNTDCLIQPLSGRGKRWVKATRLDMNTN